MKDRSLICRVILTGIIVISIISTFLPMMEINALGVSVSISFADLFQEDSLLDIGMDIIGEEDSLYSFKTVIIVHIFFNVIICFFIWCKKKVLYALSQVMGVIQFVWWGYVAIVWKKQFSTGSDFLDSFYDVNIGVGLIGYIITALVVVIFSGVLLLKNSTPKIEKVEFIESEKEGAIVCLSGEYAGAKISIKDTPIILGRDKNSCQLVFEGKNISRQHCSIAYNKVKNVYLVCDFSSNGTYIVDEKRLPKNETVELSPGDQIRIGDDNVFTLG